MPTCVMCWVNETAYSIVLIMMNKLHRCVSSLLNVNSSVKMLMALSWMDASSCVSYLFALSLPPLQPPTLEHNTLTLISDFTFHIFTHGFRLWNKTVPFNCLGYLFVYHLFLLVKKIGTNGTNLKRQLTLFLNIRAGCSSTSKHLLEEHFPARIQIFHRADRGGGYSQNQGGKSLPATSLCIGWTSIRARRAVSQSMEAQMQAERRRLHTSVNGEGQTDRQTRTGESAVRIGF